MAEMLKGLLDRVQGKSRVKEICNKVFKEYAKSDNNNLIPLDDLQVAVLRVYNYLNKNLFGPHKEPPSMLAIENEKSKLNNSGIDEVGFCDLILEWTKNDLRAYVAHKVVLSLLAAPPLAVMTKNAGERVPRIGPVVEKIPAPVFFPFYSVGLVFLL